MASVANSSMLGNGALRLARSLPARARSLRVVAPRAAGFQGWGDIGDGAQPAREDRSSEPRPERSFRPVRREGGGIESSFGRDRDRDRAPRSFGGDRRGPPETRPGDWNCSCGFSNFASRGECRQCGESNPSPSAAAAAPRSFSDRPPRRDSAPRWLCTTCNMDNLPFRTECFKCEVRAVLQAGDLIAALTRSLSCADPQGC